VTPAVWVAITFGVGNFLLALIAWRRAGRAAALAERAELRANAADSRAEEAHSILKERTSTEQERHQADLAAPAIADGWRSQMTLAAQDAQRRGKNHFGHVTLPVATLAEQFALRLIRAERDALGVVELLQHEGQASVTLLTPYQMNQKRARERR
jgi:hypothetical protein